MRTLSAAALAVLFSLTAQSKAQTGRAMTIDDLITAVRVTDPQLSPDGTRVIFVRTTTDPKTGKRNADIWSVPADGSASGAGIDWREQDRQHAALFTRRKAHRVHLDSRRRARRSISPMPKAAASNGSRISRWACSHRSSCRPTDRASRSCPTSIPNVRTRRATNA